MVIGHGIDLVDVASTERLLNDSTQQFLLQCFTDGERSSVGDGLERAARLSGRFAVKEAVLKALGLGYGAGTSFRDVEVVSLGNGAPMVELHGEPARLAASLGITRWLVSISHEGTMAIASVIALDDQAGPR